MHTIVRRSSGAVALAWLALAGTPHALAAQATAPFEVDSSTLAAFKWRLVGPANTMGRVSDVVGIPSPSKTLFVAAAAGGIWKSTNNGTTWRPVFDNERVISMGMLAIAPSDTMQVWAGTGEPNSRNSISPGGGIYKSTDGGLTWKLMGLEKTQTIGRIVVHPTNPNIVYVAALGAIWNANKERGLYKTTDGGTSWELVKFISDKAGVVDVQLDPSNPDVVWAASYERVRGPYFLKSGGPGSALWKSNDAGATWSEIKGNGFPETMKGRISIALAASNPRTMYTMVEADTAPNPKPDKAKPAQEKPSGLYRSEDGGVNWARTSSDNVRPFYYSQVRVHPKNPDRVYWSSTPVKVSDDGGITAKNATVGVHVDHHGMWIDPNDPDRMIVGNDGGIAITYDQGGSYQVASTLPLSQPYNVSFDMSVPYRVCAGLQDNGSWCGPSRRRQGAITNAMWATVAGGDGFVTQQDPTDPNTIYAESQGGNISRFNFATSERTSLVKPNWRPQYAQWEDSILVERPDTAASLSRDQRRRVEDLRARQKNDSVAFDLRWNWNTPFIISAHNPQVLYFGANRVLKSTRRGEQMYPISPDLTFADAEKVRVATRTTGGITTDATGAEMYGTIVSIAESPIRPGILFAGTDDGRVWVTKNDGGSWDELKSFPGLPPNAYVSEIEASPHDSMTVFVTFDNHRVGDFAPYVYHSADFGRSFRSIAGALPTGGPDFVHVIKQDPTNPDLLFVGTDVGVFVSLNRGQSWQKFMSGLPTVPVNDLKIHPRDKELIAATHGRAVWIVDIAALQQMTPTVVAADAFLFEPKTGYQYGDVAFEGQSVGHQWFQAPSPTYGAEISYRLGTRGSGQTRVVIQDVAGDTIRTLNGPSGMGTHKVVWDYRGKAPAAPALSPAGRRDSIITARRADFVFDSLGKAGMDTTALNRFRRMLQGGDMQQMAQMFMGGGQGQSTAWVPRPGEQAVAQRGGGGGGGRGAAAGAAAAAGITDPNVAFQIVRLLNPGGGGGGFNIPGAPRTQAPIVQPGDYLVSITVNGTTHKRTLRVERASGSGTISSFFEEDEGR
ncbi:MAG: glycosyl hydrolase [Gemmatimonadaceae bacterium]|nr:glycosyl hydrolase [Gemmatimonadaceae bacterium]